MIYVSSRDTNVPGPRGSNELWKSRVPGIAVGDQFKALDKNKLFSEYDPDYPPEGPYDSTEIFVNLPPNVEYLFASGRFLATIADGYPLSEIHVQCPEWFWPYLPEGVTPIKTRQAKYYREYNFGKGFTDVQRATTPWNQLYYIGSSILDPNFKLPVQMTNGEVPSIDIAIIGNGFHPTATQSGLAEGLENACRNSGYTTKYMHSPSDPGSVIPFIAGARSMIACGDSAYAYAAVAMGKPTVVFRAPTLPDGGFSMHNNAKHYDAWPNARHSPARTDRPPDPMEVLRALIKRCHSMEVQIGGEDE